MMGINKKELKKIDHDFRILANRFLRTHPSDADKILAMFMDFIDDTSLIKEYINSFEVEENDFEDDVNEVVGSYGNKIFYLGSTFEEEIVWTYQLLKYLVNEKISIISVGEPYGQYNDSQKRVKGFGERVVLPFVNHLASYLCKIGIDMGVNEEVRYQITVNGGQMNLAQDNATVNATQNNGIDQAELITLIQTILATIPETLAPEERTLICDSVETIQEELNSVNPKGRLIRRAKNTLDTIAPKIAGTAEFAASLASLYQFAQPFLQ